MLALDVMCELPLAFRPMAFVVRQASQSWERAQAHALRRAVFCAEQGIFLGDDRDAIDADAQLLVALACLCGMPDQLVGTVRIHRGAADGEWWGSRLAVHPSFRSQGHLGETLIRLAVSSARAQGCKRFLAHVQSQNAPLFERLGWATLGHRRLHGRPHHAMQADLSRYPPCAQPLEGFLTHGRQPSCS